MSLSQFIYKYVSILFLGISISACSGASGNSTADSKSDPNLNLDVNSLKGANCYDGLGDINGDGTIDVLDCRGQDGTPGAAGVGGATGATGPQGFQGPAGPAGPIGLTGASGVMGAQGPQGPRGATGPQGPAGSISKVSLGKFRFVQDDMNIEKPIKVGVLSASQPGPQSPTDPADPVRTDSDLFLVQLSFTVLKGLTGIEIYAALPSAPSSLVLQRQIDASLDTGGQYQEYSQTFILPVGAEILVKGVAGSVKISQIVETKLN